MLVSEVLTLLSAHPEMRDPRLTALVTHDSRNQGQLAETVLAYLNAFGDVRAAATELHVHPNTLRYRIRRAEELTGLDLSRPDQRLLAMLQLRLPPAPTGARHPTASVAGVRRPGPAPRRPTSEPSAPVPGVPAARRVEPGVRGPRTPPHRR